MTCELDDDEAIAAHAPGCARCRDELDWRRRERELMVARAGVEAPLPPALWEGVARRLGAPARAPRLMTRPRAAWAMSAMAAAAAVAIFVTNGRPRPRVTVAPPVAVPITVISREQALAQASALKSAAVLEEAETEYLNALAKLEAEYGARRKQLTPERAHRLDTLLVAAHAGMESAHETIPTVDGRLRRLDAYAASMHSMQRLLIEVKP